jgi:protoporphyrinogen oxidase
MCGLDAQGDCRMSMDAGKTAVIIGAGPAGLTAALEFCRRSKIHPIVVESTSEIGGLSRTIRYKGNRMDVGGHRFFSRSDRVMRWWTELFPIAREDEAEATVRYQNQQRRVVATADAKRERVMLLRPRRSRIYFLRRFFRYPLALDAATLRALGARRTLRIGWSYLAAKVAPRKPERTLEDFFINRFGGELFRTFFRDYTEKVWGVPCSSISAEWGARRIKGLSLRAAVVHFLRQRGEAGRAAGRAKSDADVAQRSTETSLIERFLYPKLGPGQLWEHVAQLVEEQGGEIRLESTVTGVHGDRDQLRGVTIRDARGVSTTLAADYVLSTMPVRDLIRAMDGGMAGGVPSSIREVSEGLVYRDFLTVGLLVEKLSLTEADGSRLRDTWIYIQEPDVRVGRLQIFNNWSPYLVADPAKTWIGMEYFCQEGDDLWSREDASMAEFAMGEAEKIGMLQRSAVSDWHVVRVPKSYPAYFGSYDRFSEIIEFVSGFRNLFLMGRNGMHKYNNQDHSMLTAMAAVDAILTGSTDKSALWAINTEQEYSEAKPR